MEELAAALGTTVEQIEEIRQQPVSLETPVGEGAGRVSDLVADPWRTRAAPSPPSSASAPTS